MPVAKQDSILVRVSSAERAALEEARRRSAARTVARLMEAARASGTGLDEREADLLADEAKHASRGAMTR